MKGPKDQTIEEGQVDFTLSARPRVEKPPGGKAIHRLALFSESRGLPELSVNGNGHNGAGYTKIIEGAAPEVQPKTAPEIGQLYFDAAVALQGLQTEQEPNTLGPPTGTGPFWRFLGPNMTANGQTYGDTRVIVSGRVSAIAVDPTNSNHLLCGAAGGGVWESRDRGATWTPRTDYMPTLTVGAIAFDRASPNVVYCGTGEGNFYASLGAGVLRSVDGGATWSLLASAPFVGQGFYDLIVDPGNGHHLLAATTSGIYVSNDGGVSWNLTRNGRCWDLAIHPAGGAAAEILAACGDGVFRSTNGGTSWTPVTLPGAPANFNRLAVAISRSRPEVAYAFGAFGASAFLYRRNPGGGWTAVAPPAGLATGQAWYDWFLAVSPDNDAQIYLGAIEAYRGTLSGTSWTWVTISNKAGDDIHPDQHAIAIDPANADVIYVGNDGGLFTSPNRGINWTSLNPGLGITELEYIAQDYGSARWLMGGTQDNGSVRYTGSLAWDHIADGDGGDCGVDRANPNTVFHTYFNMGMERSTTRGNFGSFSWIGPNPPAGYSSLFYPPMEVNNTTVAQAGQSVFVSRNSGTSWTEIALPAGQIASAMYIPNVNTVVVGTFRGSLFRITWSGTAWSAATAINSPRTNAWISDVFLDPTNLNRIWVAYTTIGGGRVFRTDNGGASWIDRSAGLPSLPINAIEIDPANANRVWVAADVGVYESRDGGNTWSSFANGLPNALAADLLFHPHARVLRVALRNRGVWEIPVDGVLAAPICGVQFTGSLAANQTQRWFTFNWPATWHVIWTVMPTSPQPGAPQITWSVQVERASFEFATYWITVKNLTANPVTFEGRYAILSRY
jgi:hypothetical protein